MEEKQQTNSLLQTTGSTTNPIEEKVVQPIVPQTTPAEEIVVPQTTSVEETVVPQTTSVEETVVPQTTSVEKTVVPQTTSVEETVVPQTTSVEKTVVPQTTSVEETVVPQTTSVEERLALQSVISENIIEEITEKKVEKEFCLESAGDRLGTLMGVPRYQKKLYRGGYDQKKKISE